MKFCNWLRRLFSKPKFGTGLKPNDIDERDYNYRLSGITIDGMDLSEGTGKVLNQGSSNACTAFAVCELLDYVLEHKKNIPWSFKSSKLFTWYYSRLEEGTEDKNAGVQLRNVFKTINKYGFVQEVQYPFNKNWYIIPPAEVNIAGSFFKLYLGTIPKYYAIPTNKTNFSKLISNCLTNNTPIVFGFPIHDEFINTKQSNSEINNLTGKFRGYHAMLITGERDNHYIIKNSWGNMWGDKGYCYIEKQLLKDNAIDVWTLK